MDPSYIPPNLFNLQPSKAWVEATNGQCLFGDSSKGSLHAAEYEGSPLFSSCEWPRISPLFSPYEWTVNSSQGGTTLAPSDAMVSLQLCSLPVGPARWQHMASYMAMHKGGTGRTTRAVTQHTACACRGNMVCGGAYLMVVAVPRHCRRLPLLPRDIDHCGSTATVYTSVYVPLPTLTLTQLSDQLDPLQPVQ